MSNSANDYEEILEVRNGFGSCGHAGPLYRLEWYDRDYRGLKLRDPFIRVKISDPTLGWESPWINADEIANVVKIMRENREREQSKLPIDGETVRPDKEVEGKEGS